MYQKSQIDKGLVEQDRFGGKEPGGGVRTGVINQTLEEVQYNVRSIMRLCHANDSQSPEGSLL